MKPPFIAERPKRIDEALNKLPPFIDGYAAICAYLAKGDTAGAWLIAFNLSKSAKILKPEIVEIYEIRDNSRKWRNLETQKRYRSLTRKGL